MTKTTETRTAHLGFRIGALVAIIAATLYLAWAGFQTRQPELGIAALIAGILLLGVLAAAAIVGRRGPLPIRVLGGVADERERRIGERALAHSGIAMLAGSGFGIVLGIDIQGDFVAGGIGFLGLLTLGISTLVQSRRAA